MTFWQSIIIALLPVTAAIVTLLVNRTFEIKRIKLEFKKWHADHFIERKLDAFEKLHSALIKSKEEIQHWLMNPPKTHSEFDDWLKVKADFFREEWLKTGIYLTRDDNVIMKNVVKQSRSAYIFIQIELPNEECPFPDRAKMAETIKFEIQDFHNTFNLASECLRNKLNPKYIEQFLESQS